MLHIDQTVDRVAQFTLEPSRKEQDMGGNTIGARGGRMQGVPPERCPVTKLVAVSTNDLPMETCYLSILLSLGDISNIRACMHYLGSC